MKDQQPLTNILILQLELEVRVDQTLTKEMKSTRSQLILTSNLRKQGNRNNILPFHDKDRNDYVSSERRRILEDEFLPGSDFTWLRTSDLRGLILILTWEMKNSIM